MQNIFPHTCIGRPSNANVRCNRWKLIVDQSLDFPWERYVIKDSDVLELSGGQEILFRSSRGGLRHRSNWSCWKSSSSQLGLYTDQSHAEVAHLASVTEACLELLSRFVLWGIWIEVAMICAMWFRRLCYRLICSFQDGARRRWKDINALLNLVVHSWWPSTPTLTGFLASNFWLLDFHFWFPPSGALFGPSPK